MKLQSGSSSGYRRVTPSQPTTPTTPSGPFSGGHPLAGITPSQGSSNSTPVSARRDVPPSPDAIRGSKTLHRLQNELRDRDTKERPSRFVGKFCVGVIKPITRAIFNLHK